MSLGATSRGTHLDDAVFDRPPSPAEPSISSTLWKYPGVAVLDTRGLNRALLERQHLLRRSDIGVAKMIEHLVGMQSQVPEAPYVGLWSRLDPFDPNELGHLMERRRAVRLTLMRMTLHLVTRRDCLRLRPIFQPMIETTAVRTDAGLRVAGVDRAALVAAGRAMLEAEPLTRAALGKRLSERFPGYDPVSLASVVVWSLPALQVTPRGVWKRTGRPTWAPIETWLGRPLPAKVDLDTLVLRYLDAFGPATVADAHAWSRLNGLREVFERLRPKLRTYRDEDGRELFDAADRTLPDPATPAPPRFLAEYDNVLIAHRDRRRVFVDDRRRIIGTPTVLIDGFVRATWKIAVKKGAATLTITPVGSAKIGEDVVEEGRRLLELREPDAEYDVQVRES